LKKTRINPFKARQIQPQLSGTPKFQLPTQPKAENLKQLIRLQLVDGSWPCDAVSKVLNKDLQKNVDSVFKSMDVWATAVALAYLLNNGAGNDDKYSLIIAKAKNVISTIPDALSLASAWLRKS